MEATEMARPATIPAFTCPLVGIGRLWEIMLLLSPPFIMPLLLELPIFFFVIFSAQLKEKKMLMCCLCCGCSLKVDVWLYIEWGCQNNPSYETKLQMQILTRWRSWSWPCLGYGHTFTTTMKLIKYKYTAYLYKITSSYLDFIFILHYIWLFPNISWNIYF